jgi:hypothetical protein
MSFSFRILAGSIPYTGLELRSGWVREQTGLTGDAAAAFLGPCHVPTEHLVDLDDARDGLFIRAASMAHVIVEHPACSIARAVLRQRMLVCLLAEQVARAGHAPRRDGDDIYIDDRKLTVSIAAPGPSGALVHLGVNVDPAGAPVPAIGLAELKIDPRDALDALLNDYARELAGMAHAAGKVRTVS